MSRHTTPHPNVDSHFFSLFSSVIFLEITSSTAQYEGGGNVVWRAALWCFCKLYATFPTAQDVPSHIFTNTHVCTLSCHSYGLHQFNFSHRALGTSVSIKFHNPSGGGRGSVLADRQTDRQTDEQTDRQTDRQADRQTERRTGRQTDRQIDGRTDRQTDGRTDGQTGRQTDEQTDRQTDRETWRRQQPLFAKFSNAPKNRAQRKACCVLVQNPEGKSVLGSRKGDERILLTWMSKKWGWKAWTSLIWPRTGTTGGSLWTW